MAGTVLRERGGKIINAGDLSGSITSFFMSVAGYTEISLEFTIASGDADGDFTVEWTNNPDGTPWADSTAVAKNAASALNEVEVVTVKANYVRVKYTRTSGGTAQTVDVTLTPLRKSL